MKKKDLKCIKSEQMSNRKVEILYIAHPDDYDRYFEAVSNGFLSIIGCNFYYGEPGVVPTEGELKKSKFDFVVWYSVWSNYCSFFCSKQQSYSSIIFLW